MLKNGKTGNRNGHQNGKTDLKMAKTKNPNAPLFFVLPVLHN